MKVDLPSLAAVARAGGWARPELAEAMAVAFVTSGGLAHYHHRAGAPGSGDWRGLWGIDVDRYGDHDGRDLYDPHVNAQAAYELCERSDGFSWSIPYHLGLHRPFIDVCATALTREPGKQRPVTPFAVAGAHRRIGAALDIFERVAADASIRPTRRGPQWPIPTP